MDNFLFAETVSVNNVLFAETVSVNNFLFEETVSVNNFLFAETVSVNNLFLVLYHIAMLSPAQRQQQFSSAELNLPLIT